jgi:hypothetical protein
MTFSEYCNKKREIILKRVGTDKRAEIPKLCNSLALQYLEEIYPKSCFIRVTGGLIELGYNWNCT